jgi:hypothetical protein
MPPKKAATPKSSLADERARQQLLVQERAKIAAERVARQKVKVQQSEDAPLPPPPEPRAKRKRSGVAEDATLKADAPKRVRQHAPSSNNRVGDADDTDDEMDSKGTLRVDNSDGADEELVDEHAAILGSLREAEEAEVLVSPPPPSSPARHSSKTVNDSSRREPKVARSSVSTGPLTFEAGPRPPAPRRLDAPTPIRVLQSTPLQQQLPLPAPPAHHAPLPMSATASGSGSVGRWRVAADEDFDLAPVPEMQRLGTYMPSEDRRVKLPPQHSEEESASVGRASPTSTFMWSRRQRLLTAVLSLSVLAVAVWVGRALLLAASPWGKADALARIIRESAGAAECGGAGTLENGGRVLAHDDALRLLTAAGAAWAAESLKGPDADVLSALGDVGVTVDSSVDRTFFILSPDVDAIKPFDCWLRENVLAALRDAAAAGASRVLHLAVTHWGVTLTLLLALALAIVRWNRIARDAVVQAMYEEALRALEGHHGSAVPLPQLKQHVLEALYSGPFSVMGIRAARAWPDVERRLELDARLFLDSSAEGVTGRVLKRATWVSPLKRVAARRGSSSSSASAGGLQPGVPRVGSEPPPFVPEAASGASPWATRAPVAPDDHAAWVPAAAHGTGHVIMGAPPRVL